MANTTKAAVLLLAPELAIKVTNRAQQNLISVVTVANSTQYSVSVNGTVYTITSASTGATAMSIAAQLVAAILSADVVVFNNLNGTFTITTVSLTVPATVIVSANLTNDISVYSYMGDDLCTMILADVVLQVIEEIFKTEQERAQRYLAAHLLTLANVDPTASNNGGDYIREVVGDVEYYKNGADKDAGEAFYGLTTYGVVFWEIYQRHFFRFL